MDAVVRVRINKRTGAVEFCQVDAERDGRPAAEHERLHDELAAEIGRVLDLFPTVTEVPPGTAPPPRQTHLPPPAEPTRRTDARPEVEP